MVGEQAHNENNDEYSSNLILTTIEPLAGMSSRLSTEEAVNNGIYDNNPVGYHYERMEFIT